MESHEIRSTITRNVSETLTEEALDSLIEKPHTKIRAYCGYETSGPVHLGHLVTILKLKELSDAGIQVVVLFADYHTWLNRKGDWPFIREQARAWERTFRRLGLNRAEFVLGSSYQRKAEYMDDVLTLGLNATLQRGLRSMEQIARDFSHARISQAVYPLMQIADIKHLNVDIAVGGMEQRKIHVLGREICESIGKSPFVAIHTPLISSLLGEGKMSSSIPDSMVSVDDTAEDIVRKIRKAHCPAGEVKGNPIMEIARLIIFPYAVSITLERPDKHGGNITFDSYVELETAYTEGGVHPLDLKNTIARYLTEILHGEA